MASIVIVGSGFAGIEAVKGLSRLCLEKFECYLVTVNPKLVFLPALPEVAVGRLKPEDVTWDVTGYARRNGFNIVVSRCTRIEKNKIMLENGDMIDFDYVIVATGARVAYYGVKGAKEYAMPLYTLEDAMKLAAMVPKASHICIVGAGLVGVEIAAEIKLRYNDVEVTLIDMLDKPLAILRNLKASKKVLDVLMNIGVVFRGGEKVTEVHENKVVTSKGSIECDLVIWAAGIEGNVPSIEGAKLTKGGFVEVNQFLQAVGERVYVVGDAAHVRHRGCTALKMVREAIRQASTAARNIIKSIKGDKRFKSYKPLITDCRPLVGVTMGEKQAILIVGKSFAIKTRLVNMYKEFQRRKYARLLA